LAGSWFKGSNVMQAVAPQLVGMLWLLCSSSADHPSSQHNGKARKSGLSVGSALVNRAKRDGRTGGAAAFLHTTDLGSGKPNMQSVLEANDLDEMMAMVRPGCLRGNKCGNIFEDSCRGTLGIISAPSLVGLSFLQASLAGKDFTAEKEHVVVISTGAVSAVDQERLAAERAEAEERHRHRQACVRQHATSGSVANGHG
jgi:hypothetical protein